MIIVAFDPGKVASFARFDTSRPWEIDAGEIVQTGAGRYLRPCGLHIAEVIAGADIALVEEVGAMKDQGVSSMFTFGLCVGAILNTINSHGIPLETVTPPKWKAASKLGGLADGEAKVAARMIAKDLWPQHAAIFNVARKHGVAEAALMARWFFIKGPGKDIHVEPGTPMVRQDLEQEGLNFSGES